MKSAVKVKEKRIRDIDAIIDAVKTMRDLARCWRNTTASASRIPGEILPEHGEEIDRVKKAEWLLKKLKVQLPIDSKASS